MHRTRNDDDRHGAPRLELAHLLLAERYHRVEHQQIVLLSVHDHRARQAVVRPESSTDAPERRAELAKVLVVLENVLAEHDRLGACCGGGDVVWSYAAAGQVERSHGHGKGSSENRESHIVGNSGFD